MGTPEQDLTPEEVNDPQMMQLWVAPYGTPLPAAWDDAVDVAFRFVGMVQRDVKAKLADVEVAAFGEARRDPRGSGTPELTLTWRRLLGKHAAVLPVGVYCSVLFVMSAEQVAGVAPRVALKDFEPELWGEGASCTAVLEIAEPYRTALAWYIGAPILAAS